MFQGAEENDVSGSSGVMGRPSIGGATKVTPELGAGNPLSKEPRNGSSAKKTWLTVLGRVARRAKCHASRGRDSGELSQSPALRRGSRVFTRMVLLGGVGEKTGKVRKGGGRAAGFGGREQRGGESGEVVRNGRLGERGPGATKAFIAREGLSAGRVPWRCGGAPRGPAPLGGGGGAGLCGCCQGLRL